MCESLPSTILPQYYPLPKPFSLHFSTFNHVPPKSIHPFPNLHALSLNCVKLSSNSGIFEPSDEFNSDPLLRKDGLGIDFVAGGKDGDLDDDNLVKIDTLKEEKVRKVVRLMRRSNVIAKQVISIQSAASLGFIAELWVDTSSWVALVVEVRSNLLSGDLERFLLKDICQIGDVVLVQDESVMEAEFRMRGLETLIGYNVVTPGRRDIGKVRGYTFDINSGLVESLELDSFGISIIPSRLVSTYVLLVEDVLEVLSDTVVVREAAASRIQRLTKGFWGLQNVGTSIYYDDDDSLGDYSNYDREAGKHGGQSSTRDSDRWRYPEARPEEDEWELPIDYI